MDLHQRASIFPTYEELLLSNPDRVDELLEALKEYKRDQEQATSTSTRFDNSARTQDVTSTCKMMENELKELTERRQTASFLLVAPSDASNSFEPYHAVDETSRRFFEIVCGMSLTELYASFDAFALGGLENIGQSENERRNILKKSARQMLQRKLCDFTKKPHIKMQYVRYETDIVHKYGVELSGWPLDTFALDRVSRESLQNVVNGLANDSIKWTKLSDEELNARIDAWKAKQGNEEKTKKTKKTKKSKKSKKRARPLSDESDEEVDNNIDDEEAPTASEQCLDKEALAAEAAAPTGDVESASS